MAKVVLHGIGIIGGDGASYVRVVLVVAVAVIDGGAGDDAAIPCAPSSSR